MRPILAFVISAVLLWGVYAYTQFANNLRASAVEYIVDFADEEYTIEINRTFDLAPDPILGGAVSVLLKGESVYSSDVEIPASEPIMIGPVEGIETGENEIYISANRQSSDAALAVMQVLIKKDDITIHEQMIVSQPGLPMVSDTITFVAGEITKDEDEHDH